jgi:hypothetical protein
LSVSSSLKERRCVVKVVVEVAEGGEECMLLDLGLLEVLLLERLLIESSLILVLAGGVLPLALAPTRMVVARASLLLALLGATGDKVVKVTIVVASVLRLATWSTHTFVVEPCEPTSHKHQLLIPKALHLLLYDGQQRRQNKHSR